MINTIFGTKSHLTQTWNKAGVRMPVTVINTYPMQISQIKDDKKDGYQAIQICFKDKKWSRINKPLKGHLKKTAKLKTGAKTKQAPSLFREIKVKEIEKYKVGDVLNPADILKQKDTINAQAISKGRGFTGVVKRYGFKGGPRTHGQSDRQRAPGSIGQGTDPGRVHKGKKMPGHHGAATVTVRNLKVIKVDSEKQELWLKGQVPGAKIH